MYRHRELSVTNIPQVPGDFVSEGVQQSVVVPARVYEHDYLAIKRCRHGTFMYNVHDQAVGRSLELYGEWCEGELNVLAQLIKPGELVLDVGTYIGTHTIFFSKQVGDAGYVIAFEPQRLAFQTLWPT